MNSTTAILSKQEDISSTAIDEQYKTLSAQRAQELNDSLEKRNNNSVLPKGFYIREKKLMYQPEITGDSDDLPLPIFICSELNITACTRDKDNENHGRLLEFQDLDGHLHTWAMPMELLAGDGTEYRKELLSKGLIITPGSKPRNLLTNYIQQTRPLARARCVQQVGWYDNLFVLPYETIGKADSEKVLLQTTSSNVQNYAISGSLADWQDNVAVYCQGNSRLLFAGSAAFVSPLLLLLGYENMGFHYRGLTSTGKTTALSVGASVWGGKDYMQSWRTTVNGIEFVAACHNDAFLPLDEIGQIDPLQVGEVAYMLANGAGKIRADKASLLRKKQSWRLCFFSTGEINLEEHMEAAGKKAKGGQKVRLIDIPAETGKYGSFEDLHGCINGSEFSDMLKKNCHQYHGIAARIFIENLIVKKKESIDFVKNIIKKFTDKHKTENISGQIHRPIAKFALVAAAGELATHFGITGWDLGEAFEAAGKCLEAMLRDRGGFEEHEETQALSQIRRFFEQHGESRFTAWSDHLDNVSKTINRAGFKKNDTELGTEFFVFQGVFKKEICSGLDYRFVEQVLIKKGWIKSESEKRSTRSERLPGYTKNVRCYRFTEKVIADGDD